jgi:hypothetical protein
MSYGVRQPTSMETGYFIQMDPHPDRTTNRDPRKVWMYECCSGKFAATFDIRLGPYVTYYFESEQDFLLFKLRWEY